MKIYSIYIVLVSIIVLNFNFGAEARNYRDKVVGNYLENQPSENTKSIQLVPGQSLLSFMKDQVYPHIKAQADHQSAGRDHLAAIANAEGVELKLTDEISTYHIKYEKHGDLNAERSGRSFGAVGFRRNLRGQTIATYIADASYSYYFSSLEEALHDVTQSENFYRAILLIVINSDPSGLDALSEEYKRVAADFVAVYVAEQYRRLIRHDGTRLERRRPWDNAHLQVTLLANFHAGQSNTNRGMYYHGTYLREMYPNIIRVSNEDSGDREQVCPYRDTRNPQLQQIEKVPFRLKFYTQFNSECARSGVNMTRREFEKLGAKITSYLNSHDELAEIISQIYFSSQRHIRTRQNINRDLTNFIVSNRAPQIFDNPGDLITSILNYILMTRELADEITEIL